MDYVDLYLIHYPVPERLRSWGVLEGLRASGKTRSIGVSNFTIRHLTELLAKTGTVPAVNQVELHPYLCQRELLEYCRENHIVIEAYSPLTHGERLADPKLVAIAKKYPSARPQMGGAAAPVAGAKSTAQILIRWALQHDIVVIPKSANRQRIIEDAMSSTSPSARTTCARWMVSMKTLGLAGTRRMRHKRATIYGP